MLESRAFQRNSAGVISAYKRVAQTTAGQDVVIRVPLSPAIEIESLADAGPVTMGAPTLSTAQDNSLAFGALESVAFSELVRDIEAVRALVNGH
jgi:hypothetical protein